MNRPTMVLEDGTTWALPVAISEAISQVIEVTASPALNTASRYRTRDRAISLMVTQGRLRIEAAFNGTLLEPGDSVVIGAGVPHRLTGDSQQTTSWLVFIAGDWDGTL